MMQKLKIFRQKLGKFFILDFIIILVSLVCYFVIQSHTKQTSVLDNILNKNLPFLLHNLIFLLIFYFFFRCISYFFFINKHKVSFHLRTKIITFFTIFTIIPCSIVAIFAIFFLNNGMQKWFDSNMSDTIVKAQRICKGYVIQAEDTLKDAAINYASKIEKTKIDNQVLNDNDLYGIFSGAIVFRTNPNVIIAHTDSYLSFLNVENIPFNRIKDAKQNKVSVFPIYSNTLCALVNLEYSEGVYLALFQTLDPILVEHADKTQGIIRHYYHLKSQLKDIQFRFAVIFVTIVLILMFISIAMSMIFAKQITSPILNLVKAVNAVKKGDFSIIVDKGKSNDEITTLAVAFNEMITKLNKQRKEIAIAQKEIVWSDLAKKVAHEINNPLTPIQLSAELLLKKFLPKNKDDIIFKKYLHNILNNIDNIKDIIAAFSYFGRLTSINAKKQDFIEWIYNIIEARKIISSQIRYEIQSNVVSLQFLFDKKQLSQAINNFLLNCEQNFQIKGTVNPKIKTYIVSKNNKFKIVIVDNGSGFPESILESEFVKPYTSAKSSGMGIGIIISKKIIEDHGGKIQLSNYCKSSMKGAIVTISFQSDNKIRCFPSRDMKEEFI